MTALLTGVLPIVAAAWRFHTMIGLQRILLIAAGFLAVLYGPFPEGGSAL
jgi:hypothetical membrane protein